MSGATLSRHISIKGSNACVLTLQVLLASADRRVKGDRVWRDPVKLHLPCELQRLLTLHDLLTSADRCAEGDSV